MSIEDGGFGDDPDYVAPHEPMQVPEKEEDYFTRHELSKVFSLAQAIPDETLGLDPIMPTGVPKELKFGDVNFSVGLETAMSHLRGEAPYVLESRLREGTRLNEYSPRGVVAILDSLAEAVMPKNRRRGVMRFGFTPENIERVRQLINNGTRNQLVTAYNALVLEAMERRANQ